MNILIAAPVRNREFILERYLKCLSELDYPKNKIGFCFILNDSIDQSHYILSKFNDENKNKYLDIIIEERNRHYPEVKRSERDLSFYENMAYLRNEVLGIFSRRNKYDKLFSIDTDVLIKPKALIQLINARKNITSILVNNDTDNKYYNVGKVTDKYIYITKPPIGMFQCDVTGSAILIDRSVISAGVKYGADRNGEDVAFCLSARSKGYTIWCVNRNLGSHELKENAPNIVMSAKKIFNTGSIAITCYSGIGDAIYASAIATALKRKFNKTLHAYVGDYGMSILPDNPNIDKILTERTDQFRLQKSYDEVYALDNPIYRKISTQRDTGFTQRYNTIMTQMNKKRNDQSANWYDFIEMSALDMANFLFGLNSTIKDCFISPDFSFNIEAKEYVTIHDWSARGRQTKNWYPERWAPIINYIKSKYGLPVYQLGEGDNSGIEGTISLLGKTSVKQSFGIIKNSSLHLDMDSSMTHACAVMDVPCISLWGPTSVKYWGHTENTNITSKTECLNCWGNRFGHDWWSKCIRGRDCDCMRRITAEQLISEIDLKLSQVKKNNISLATSDKIAMVSCSGIGDAIIASAAATGIKAKTGKEIVMYSGKLGRVIFEDNSSISEIRDHIVTDMNSMDSFLSELLPSYFEVYDFNRAIFKKLSHIEDGKYEEKRAEKIRDINSHKNDKFYNDYFSYSAFECANDIFELDIDESDCPIKPDNYISDMLPEKYVTLHDWSPFGKQVKNWDADRWSEVISYIKKNIGMDVYQIGDESSQKIEGAIHLIGKTTLKQSFGVIQKSSLHLDIDSSTAHIASLLNVPSIVLWGATSSKYWGHDNQIKIISDFKCKNCWGNFINTNNTTWPINCERKFNAQCMKNISVKDIIDKIDSIFNKDIKKFIYEVPKKFKIKISGPATDPSGYSSALRHIAVSLKKYGHRISINDVFLDKQVPDVSRDLNIIKPCFNKSIKAEVGLYITTPNIAKPMLNDSEKSIINFFWETSRLPSQWISELNSFDAIFSPSTYQKKVVEWSGVTTPTFVTGHVIDTDFFCPQNKIKNKDKFIFYSIFQWTDRKNPKDMLHAYWKEFMNIKDVVLILKTYMAGTLKHEIDPLLAEYNAIKNQFEKENKGTLPKVRLITNLLSLEEIKILHRDSDCFILLHRGEGLGLPIVQAMSSGRPAITTNYYACEDYMNNESGYPVNYSLIPVKGMSDFVWYGEDQEWASPNVDHARKLMRDAYENRKQCCEKGILARELILLKYSYKPFISNYNKCMQEVLDCKKKNG